MKKTCIKLIISALAFTSQAQVVAQPTYPIKPVTVVVPFAAGGTTDVVARIIQTPLAKLLGQPIIIENRAGASGLIGTKHVQAATPDGHTLLMPNNGFLIPPIKSRSSGYDAEKSFEPVILISKQPLVLAVHPSVKANNLKEFLAEAKSKPGEMTFASSGAESITQAFTEVLAQKAGINILHVPYKGQGPSLQAVYAGEVNALLNVSSGQMKGLADAGKIRLLGVASAEQTPLAPGVPTISSQVPGFSGDVWFGFFTPKGTPTEVVTKLNEAVNTVLTMPDVQQKIIEAGAQPIGGTPEGLAQQVRKELAELKAVVVGSNDQSPK